MMPSDDEFIGQVAKAVARLMAAIELDEPQLAVDELAKLLGLLTKHRTASPRRDEALRRALARLG